MRTRTPASAPRTTLISTNEGEPPSWEQGEAALTAGADHSPGINGTYWLATVKPDGGPHVMPLFGVWVKGAMYFCSGPKARKTHNLETNPACTVAVAADGIDIVIGGTARKVVDQEILGRVAAAFGDKHGWPVRPRDGMLDADYTAPTAGPSPLFLFEVRPTRGYGLGTSEP